MSEILAEKACTPCRGGIPPLARDEALRFPQASVSCFGFAVGTRARFGSIA